MKNNSPLPAIIIFLSILFLAWVYQFSRSIGADFQTTLEAIWQSIPVLIVAGAAWWFLRFSALVLASGLPTLLFPIWWPVIDSIANGGATPDTLMLRFPQEVWWDTTWFKYGTEGMLAALFVYLIWRSWDSYA